MHYSSTVVIQSRNPARLHVDHLGWCDRGLGSSREPKNWFWYVLCTSTMASLEFIEQNY